MMKNKVKLPSKRLTFLANFVEHPCSLIDVGCDHGYISIYFANQEICKKVIAIDVSEQCLEKAKINAKLHQITNIEFILCDGLSKVKAGDYEACIIAGIGSEQIIKIIEDKPKNINIKYFYLQPSSKVLYLKQWLNKNNFKIDKDEIIYEKKQYYNCLKVEKGEQRLLFNELFFGKDNVKNQPLDFKNYVIYNYKKLKKYSKKSNKKELIDLKDMFENMFRRINNDRCN